VFSCPSLHPKVGGKKDPASCMEGAGPAGSWLMANSCGSPHRPSSQAEAQPGQTDGWTDAFPPPGT
jgi:hypothetical protein